MQTLIATRDSEGFEPLSILMAELLHLLRTDGRSGEGLVGHLYDPNGKPITIVRTDGTYHQSSRFNFPAQAPSGSQNYHPTAYACRVLSGYQRDDSIEAFRLDWELSQGKQTVPGVLGLMGTEVGLGNYFPAHFLSRLAASRYSLDAARWVERALALITLSRFTSQDLIAHVGQRGAVPGKGKPNWVDALGTVLTGGSVDKYRKGYGWPHEWVILDMFAHVLARNFGPHTYNLDRAIDVLNGTYTRVRWEWLYRGDKLVATYQSTTVHGSTPPMLAAALDKRNKVVHLPRDGGRQRIREKSDRAVCMLRGGRLLYRAKFSKPSPDELELQKYDRVVVWEGRTVKDAKLT